jgi:hypothetical protein
MVIIKILNKIRSFFLRPLLIYKFSKITDNYDNLISTIVFSKDRPIQLDAFLKSLNHYFKGEKEILVLYNYSSLEYKKAYEEVFYRNNITYIINEQEYFTFKEAVIYSLKKVKSERIIFFVDDIIVTDFFSTNDFLNINLKKSIFSLRLGSNLSYSYVVKKYMNLPKFSKENGFLIWNWNKSHLDWAYPISLDGNLFLKSEIIILLDKIHFKSPNTLEDSMQILKSYFGKRKGICFETSKLFNNPCNKVQNDNNNFHGNLHQNLLLQYWNEGKRIDSLSYFKYNNTSVHEEVEFKLIK